MTPMPDYSNLVNAAFNKKPSRIPFYEHQIADEIISKVTGFPLSSPDEYTDSKLDGYFSVYCNFYRDMGYDTVSFERILSGIMPGNGALYGHAEGCIKNYDDFAKYPWQDLKNIYFSKNKRYFDALRRNMPNGMKAVGGIGNGIFECAQDITGYMNLCFIKADDPELYSSLFKTIGDVLHDIWSYFLEAYSDIFCIVRMGDDLGFKTNTLLPPEDIISFIIPGYKKIIDLAHSYKKPFLLHSCGNLFHVMDALIKAGIDAKHSNEDEIAPMKVWYENYGSRIGNFGGIDADILCRFSYSEIKEYVTDIYNMSLGYGGVAIGSGNSIPHYVPVENYLAMINILKELREY